LQDKTQGRRLLYESIRRMLSAQVYDVIAATREALQQAAPADVDAIRHLPPLIQFSATMRDQSALLKRFLLQKLYRHPQVMQTTALAQQVVRELFAVYVAQPTEMPESFVRRATLASAAGDAPAQACARAVADYIAGMTDRFAAREHERLTGLKLLT
jgi:dGTPase